jgi:glucoamylase
MCHSATGLLAAGNTETPLRALIYLACSQESEGGFYQNFWINGEPYWRGIQLDEVAFPILLAWRLHIAGVLRHFDPYPMVLRAARYLIQEGPATQQEHWEENSGYSPSTLASNIAALTCAALFARERGDAVTAQFIQQYADFLECHIEAWTVTTQGTLIPAFAATSSACIRSRLAIHTRTRILAEASCRSAIARRSRRGNSPRKTSSMQGSLSWCVTAFANLVVR